MDRLEGTSEGTGFFIQRIASEILEHLDQQEKSLASCFKEIESSILKQALREHRGNQTHVAERVGLKRTTTVMKMKKHGIFRSE